MEDDLGMLGGDVDDAELVVRPFARDTMVAVVSPAHPWAKRKSVSLAALGREPLILRELRLAFAYHRRRADCPLLRAAVELIADEHRAGRSAR